RFEHHDRCPLAKDEAVAVLVKRPGSVLWIVVALGEGADPPERDERERHNGRLGATSQDRLGVAPPEKLKRLVEGVDAGRAGCDVGYRWPFQPEVNRDLAGGHVRDHRRNEERVYPLRPALQKYRCLVYDLGAPTPAGR